MELSTKTTRRLLEEAGAEDVEEDAAEELADTIELFAGYISEEAVGIAQESKRKVITKDDVEQALE
ncbi:MAG: histone [Candidatus Nanohaloarchaea archaeon]|nr:histone [Candidatus Nanohaloarchaea archaeon]